MRLLEKTKTGERHLRPLGTCRGLKNQGFGLRLSYVYLLPITPIPVPL